MLDENLPTYRSRVSSDNPLNTILYYTHHGSEPRPEYILKRPAPGQAPNQYALGLFDVQYSSVVYAEVLVKPDWTQPTLSAAEVRASGGNAVALPVVPHSFSVSLYNPDQSITVRYQTSSWSKDSWEFEVPETSFKTPSASEIDRDASTPVLADLIPRLNFHWKRDSRMNRDMTCYMSGRTVGGKKAKEPDITVALFQAGKTEGAVAIYEPNMNRVEVEDRKGLELVLLLSAEVIRDLFLSPRHDLFNTSGNPAPNGAKAGKAPRKNSSPPVAAMSGALNNMTPTSPQQPSQQQFAPPQRPPAQDPRRAEIDAESKRLQKLVAEEKAKSRDRERQDREEQQRIREMLEQEEREDRERRQREVDAETERLRREYGVNDQPNRNGARSPPSPALPPRRPHGASMSGAGGGWQENQPGPARPQSVGPGVQFAADGQPVQQGAGGSGGSGGRRQKLNQFLSTSPYAGPAAASVSGFFGSNSAKTEEEKQKKMKKKRSVHF